MINQIPKRRSRQFCFTDDEDSNIDKRYTFENHKIKSYDIFSELSHWKVDQFTEFINMNENKAMFISDKFNKILYVNDKWCTICGFSVEEIIGNSFKELHGPETDIKTCKKFLLDLYKSDKAEMKIINYSKNKKKLKLKVFAKKVKSSRDSIQYIGFIEEI